MLLYLGLVISCALAVLYGHWVWQDWQRERWRRKMLERIHEAGQTEAHFGPSVR
jgi:uncharacterized membrane protein YccC